MDSSLSLSLIYSGAEITFLVCNRLFIFVIPAQAGIQFFIIWANIYLPLP